MSVFSYGQSLCFAQEAREQLVFIRNMMKRGGGRPDMSVHGWTAVYPLFYQLVKLAFCIEPGFSSFPSGGQKRLCGLKDTRDGRGVVSKKIQQSHLAASIDCQSLLRI